MTRLITMDCDGQHEPAHIPQFLAALAEGGDIVSGSRYLPGSATVGVRRRSRQAINQRITAEINARHRVGAHRRVLRLQGVPAAGARLHPARRARLRDAAGAVGEGVEVRARRCARFRSSASTATTTARFGAGLDDPEARYAYYIDVWNRALKEDS